MTGDDEMTKAELDELRLFKNEVRRIVESCEGDELIESLRFLLDMDPKGKEWLPEPAEPGTLPESEPEEVGDTRDRTLTLPNGTEVQTGDVLVDCTTEGSKTMPIRVTAVGEKGWLALMYWLEDGELKPYPGYSHGNDYAAEAHYNMPDEYQRYADEGGYRDWKPWSEVYPDRPVPGESL